MNSPPLWVTLVVVLIPFLGTVVAAVIASRSASSARESEAEVERLRRLELRVAEERLNVYRPMLDTYGRALGGATDELTERLQDIFPGFATWISIYGSDDAVLAFNRLMQCAYHDAPSAVIVRAYADFVLAARRDLGDGDTTTTAVDVMGIRLNDLYQGQLIDDLRDDFEAVASRHGWTPPWSA